MIKSIEWQEKLLLLKPIAKSEARSISKLKPSEQYGKYLDLVINKRFRINDFNGNINELQALVTRIKKEY